MADDRRRHKVSTRHERKAVSGRKQVRPSRPSRSVPTLPAAVGESFDLGGGTLVDVDERFCLVEPLSDVEHAQAETARFHHTPEYWRQFAWSIHRCVLHSYEAGEINFRRMMEIMRGCSLWCEENDRAELLLRTADRGRSLQPRALNRSAPPYPAWQRQAAIDLVLELESLSPEGSSAQHRDDALARLTAVGLATENTVRRRPLSTRTLQRWVEEYRQDQGQSRPSGRPRRKRHALSTAR